MIEYYINSNKYSLQERQTKKGKVYDVIFRVITLDGKQKQKKLSRYNFVHFTSKALAKEGYLRFIKERCELINGNPIKLKEEKKVDPTIGQLFPLYISAIKNQNKNSVVYEKQNVFKRLLLPQFRNLTLEQLDTETLYRWQDELWATKNPKTNEYYSYKHLTKIRTIFSAFLSWCETRYGYTNNLLKVKKPKKRAPQKQMEFWTRDNFNAFINAIESDINNLKVKMENASTKDKKDLHDTIKSLEMYRTLFFVFFYTGRRKGEVLALTPDDVKSKSIMFNKSLSRKTLTEATWEITSTKTERQDATPICPALEKELKNYKPQSPFFFGGSKPIGENTLTRVFQKYTTLSKNKKIRIHDLRHSFVSMMAHINCPLVTIASLIGDTLEQTTRTYMHLYTEDKTTYLNMLK